MCPGAVQPLALRQCRWATDEGSRTAIVVIITAPGSALVLAIPAAARQSHCPLATLSAVAPAEAPSWAYVAL